jgi:hypothetical protein
MNNQQRRAQFIALPQPVLEPKDVSRDTGMYPVVKRKTQVLSLLALLVALAAIVELGLAAYHAVRDPLIAPIVLSPDSELVLPSKLMLSRMLSERDTLEARRDESSATAKADEQAIKRLRDLKSTVSSSLQWTDDITAKIENTTSGELRVIGEQKRLIARNIKAQQAYVNELKKSLAVGLVRRTDVLREEAELNRMRLAGLQMERDRLGGEGELYENKHAQDALHKSPEEEKALSPEMVQQNDHLVRIELELLKLEADQRSRTTEVQSLTDQMKKSDELIAEIKSRPVFSAVEAEQNVAFVPYTQIEGVKKGAALYDCDLWSIFFCRKVGEVENMLPGEVSMNDPWGSPARGRYAMLSLSEASAATAKVLHVRDAE